MGRPRKHVRDADKPPRSFSEIQRVVEMAQMLYRVNGGESLDKHIRSMDHTADMYDVQVQASAAYGDEAAKAYGPNITGYEARMSASTSARLHALREKKMAQCLAWAEEGAEADALRKADAGKPAAASGEAREREASKVSQPNPLPQARPKDGDSPSAKVGRGQSPAEQPPDEFCDATKSLHREAVTTRIAQMLSGLGGTNVRA